MVILYTFSHGYKWSCKEAGNGLLGPQWLPSLNEDNSSTPASRLELDYQKICIPSIEHMGLLLSGRQRSTESVEL